MQRVRVARARTRTLTNERARAGRKRHVCTWSFYLQIYFKTRRGGGAPRPSVFQAGRKKKTSYKYGAYVYIYSCTTKIMYIVYIYENISKTRRAGRWTSSWSGSGGPARRGSPRRSVTSPDHVPCTKSRPLYQITSPVPDHIPYTRSRSLYQITSLCTRSRPLYQITSVYQITSLCTRSRPHHVLYTRSRPRVSSRPSAEPFFFFLVQWRRPAGLGSAVPPPPDHIPPSPQHVPPSPDHVPPPRDTSLPLKATSFLLLITSLRPSGSRPCWSRPSTSSRPRPLAAARVLTSLYT